MIAIKLIFSFFLYMIFFLIGFFHRPTKEIWIFSSWKGQKKSDNAKYFYDDLDRLDEKIHKVWIVKKKSISDNNSYYYLSFKGLYCQFFSTVSFCTHSNYSDFLGYYLILSRKVRVQLWHGSPLKKIMYDVKSNFLSNIKKKIFDRYNIIICPNESFVDLYQRAFRVSSDKVLVSGQPRLNHVTRKEAYENKILYAPTFRDGFDYFNYLSGFGFDFFRANDVLKEKNQQLYIRLHPSDKLKDMDREIISLSSNIHLDTTDDIYENLHTYSALIVDYSSIFFDFLIFDRPILFAPFDLEEYTSALRGCYFSYDEIAKNNKVSSWNDVINHIESGFCHFDFDELNRLHDKFSENLDIDSCLAIYKKIISLKVKK